MSTNDISIEYPNQGGIACSAIVNGYYVHRLYIGHNKREAIELFKAEFN